MADYKIDSTSAASSISKVDAFSVDTAVTDGIGGQRETEWQDSNWSTYFGYYTDEKVPEITSIINTSGAWTIGKGFKADEETTILLDTIRGNGFDTFNSILTNMEKVGLIGGNSYCEIIRDDEDNFINLKPLDPSVMKHHANRQGIITHFSQMSKTPGVSPKKFKANQIFYLPYERVADEIHGRGIIQKLKKILDMKNEAMADNRIAMHQNVVPRWKFKLKTDDPTEIAAYKAKMDTATGARGNVYEPFDVSESELVSVPPNSTLNPLAWINYLDNLLYQTGRVPKIVVGGSSEFTEKASSIVYLAFQQNVEARQLFIEEQVLAQLNLVIELEFPADLTNELLSDKKKDGPTNNIQPNETTAGAGQ